MKKLNNLVELAGLTYALLAATGFCNPATHKWRYNL